MSDEYTPDRGTVRYRYVEGDYSGGNRDPHAEFDRFIAKIKADALREAAGDLIRDAGLIPMPNLEHPAVRALLERADQIEEAINDDE